MSYQQLLDILLNIDIWICIQKFYLNIKHRMVSISNLNLNLYTPQIILLI